MAKQYESYVGNFAVGVGNATALTVSADEKVTITNIYATHNCADTGDTVQISVKNGDTWRVYLADINPGSAGGAIVTYSVPAPFELLPGDSVVIDTLGNAVGSHFNVVIWWTREPAFVTLHEIPIRNPQGCGFSDSMFGRC